MADPETEQEAFLLEIEELEAEVAGRSTPPDPKLGSLFTVYKMSPEHLQLEAPSKKSYLRAMDALAHLRHQAAVQHRSTLRVKTRDEVFDVRGRWLANMVAAILSVALG